MLKQSSRSTRAPTKRSARKITATAAASAATAKTITADSLYLLLLAYQQS